YVFAQHWAERYVGVIDGFVTASRRASAILATSNDEWQRLKPITGAVSDAELERLRDWYRRGIPRHWNSEERRAAGQLLEVLTLIGGEELVGPTRILSPGTFWPVTWSAGA